MRSDMVPDAVFPDYELSDHTGARVLARLAPALRAAVEGNAAVADGARP